MAKNVFFGPQTRNEQNLLEDIIIESLKAYGHDVYYIPRKLVSKDDILGEDRLAKFEHAYPIEMYLENVEGFDGQGSFMSKFGIAMEQQATFVVSRRRWDQLVGKKGTSILAHRPAEGDLIFFPLTKGLFEIKFVMHKNPFYQLGKLYVYKLKVELLTYSSERIETNLPEVNDIAYKNNYETDIERAPAAVTSITVTNEGADYTWAEAVILSDKGFYAELRPEIEDGKIKSITVLNSGINYAATDSVMIA